MVCRFLLACSSLQRSNFIVYCCAHYLSILGGRGRGRGGRGRGRGGRGRGEGQLPVVQTPFMGEDGNLFYCNVCRDVGDVVCCDGCPNVYHPTCVPRGVSRSSLEADEEPWYCPECFGKHHDERTRAASTVSVASDTGRRNKRKRSSGAADDEEGVVPPSPGRGFRMSGRSRGRGRGRGGRGGRGSTSPKKTLELPESPTVAKKSPGRPKRTEEDKEERKRIKALTEMLHDEADDEERERRHKNNDSDFEDNDVNLHHFNAYEDVEGNEDIASMIASENEKPTGATPAFFIFIAENRPRIEKDMIKRHRSFRSMGRGYERNSLVAKEGGGNVAQTEHRRSEEIR